MGLYGLPFFVRCGSMPGTSPPTGSVEQRTIRRMDTHEERRQSAVIAAACLAMEELERATKDKTGLPPRHGWKMAGRLERLGMSSRLPYTTRQQREVSDTRRR